MKVFSYLPLNEAYKLSVCKKLLYKAFQSPIHWKDRFVKDFRMKLNCENMKIAKSIYRLMVYSWDNENMCFDLK